MRKCAKYGIFLGINFPANAFSGSLSGNIYHWFFPLKREGDRAVFAHCWRFFAPAACRWGCRPLAKVRGGAGAWQRRKAGYQLHGGWRWNCRIKEGISSNRRVVYATKKACGRLGGARGRRDRSSVARDGEAWMWAG